MNIYKYLYEYCLAQFYMSIVLICYCILLCKFAFA